MSCKKGDSCQATRLNSELGSVDTGLGMIPHGRNWLPILVIGCVFLRPGCCGDNPVWDAGNKRTTWFSLPRCGFTIRWHRLSLSLWNIFFRWRRPKFGELLSTSGGITSVPWEMQPTTTLMNQAKRDIAWTISLPMNPIQLKTGPVSTKPSTGFLMMRNQFLICFGMKACNKRKPLNCLASVCERSNGVGEVQRFCCRSW